MKLVRLMGKIRDRTLTIILVSATNTRTKMRYAFAIVRSEEVKVSGTRSLVKILATRMSWRVGECG
jgi:hypothetical protein